MTKNLDVKNMKQRIMSKMRSWSSKDNKHLPDEGTSSNEAGESSLEAVEKLTCNNPDKGMGRSPVQNSKSVPFTSPRNRRTVSPSCGSVVPDKATDTSRSVTWDPWNKLGRKKEKRKNKTEKSSDDSVLDSKTIECYPDTCGEPQSSTSTGSHEDMLVDDFADYSYKPYAKKSVYFKNEVNVMYFTSEEVVLNGTELLKKEADQQMRNKEMRRGHVPCTIGGRGRGEENYMAGWFKR